MQWACFPPPLHMTLSLHWTTKSLWSPTPSSLHSLLIPPPTPTFYMDKSKTKWKRMTNPMARDFVLLWNRHAKQGGLTYWVRWNRRLSLPWVLGEWPICCCKIVDFDGRSQRYPSRRRDQESSVDSPLFKSISKASCCLLYGCRISWWDWPNTLRKYTWLFIRVVANLEPAVVSINSSLFYIFQI